MTTHIILQVSLPAATVPDSRTYNELLAGNANLLQWLVPDASRRTLVDGRLSVLADRAAAAKSATQGTAGNRPLLEATGAPSGNVDPDTRPCLYFDFARTDMLTTSVVVPTGASAKWTKVILVKAPAETTSNVFHDLMSGNQLSSTSGGIHRLAIRGVNSFQNRVGITTALAQANATLTPDTWSLVMATWDGTTNTAKVNVNGGAYGTSTVAGAQCDNAVLNLGGVASGNFTGRIADAMFWDIDLSASAHAATLAIVKQYYRDRYGLTIA